MQGRIWAVGAALALGASTAPMAVQAQGATTCDQGPSNVNSVYFTPNSTNTDHLKDQLTYVAKRLGGTGTAVVTGRFTAAERSVAGIDQARAEAVVKKLVSLGVKESQLSPAAGGVMTEGDRLTQMRVDVCIKGAVYPPPG
jgi:outer membrane protein OmpA-like peptidoglycan-associated protein